VLQRSRVCSCSGHIERASLLLFAVLCVIVNAHSIRAEEISAIATPAQVRISYEVPSDDNLRQRYEALKRRRVLERLQGFLTPLRLPKELTIRLAQCGAETMPYRSGGPVTICYEMVQRIVDVTAQHTKDPDEQALIMDGTFIEAVLHEVAQAIFDLLQVPVWGRENDAADRLAALVMMQFGDRLALTTIIGTAKFFEYSKHAWTGGDFAVEESPEAQRFYNYLCIAYGGDPITFEFLEPRPGPSRMTRLPERRAGRCAREYDQVRHAFDQRIMPFVDPDLVIKVRASQWLLPDEYPESVK
jgi:hypothetical protein